MATGSGNDRGPPPHSVAPALGARVEPRTSGGGRRGGARDVRREVFERLLARGYLERDLLAHFARLPPSYQLYVNAEKAEDVLIHQKVLAEAKNPDRRPAFDVHYLMLEQLNVDTPTNSDTLEEEDDGDTGLANRSGISCKHIHEIVFCSIDNPRLLSQLSALLSDIGLNVRDVRVFSAKGRYSLDVFVVDGWPSQETNVLRKALEASILRNKETNVLREALEASILRNMGQSSGGIRTRLNEEYHKDVMAHFHSILATEVSFLMPAMTAIFSMETTLTVETKIGLIFGCLVIGVLSLLGLIMSSGTVERQCQTAARRITLSVTIFTLAIFQFTMGLFFPQFAKKATDIMGTESLEVNVKDPWYVTGNVMLFVFGATILVLLWRRLFSTPQETSGEMS